MNAPHRKHLRTRLVLLVSLLGLALPQLASAQGLTAPVIGTGESGPVTADAAAIYWNPSLLSSIKKPMLLIGGSLIGGKITYRRERRATYQNEESLDFALPVDATAIDSSKTGFAPEVSAQPLAPAPSFFFAYPLKPESGLVLGFGVYVPYAAMASYDKDGAQKWALREAFITAVNFTPAISYRASKWLSLGAGVSYVGGLASLSRVQDFAGLSDVGDALAGPPLHQTNDFGPNASPGVRELAVMSRPIAIERALANSFTFNVGLTLSPSDNFRVGLTYQHGTDLTYRGTFRLDMDDDFFTGDLAAQGLKFKPLVEGDAWISFPVPRTIHGGLAWQVGPRFGLALTSSYAFWSSLKAFDITVQSPDLAQPEIGLADTSRMRIERNWMNTVSATLTGKVKISDAFRLWLLGGYRSSASPDETVDAASPDGDRFVGGVGGRYQLGERYALIGDLSVHTILPRTVVGSANDIGNGEYRLTLFAAGLHLEATF